MRWNKANGKVLKGLTLRREAEKVLFILEHETIMRLKFNTFSGMIPKFSPFVLPDNNSENAIIAVLNQVYLSRFTD